MKLTVLVALALLGTSQAAALELAQPGSRSWPRHLLQSTSQPGRPKAPNLPDRDPAVRHIASAAAQYAAYQYYPPSLLPRPRSPRRTLPPYMAFLAKYILGRSPSQAQQYAAAALDGDPDFLKTLRAEASETLGKQDAGGSSRLKVHADEDVPGWDAFPDASDKQAWLNVHADAEAAVQLQQRLGNSLAQGGSIHQALIEDAAAAAAPAAAGTQEQEQQPAGRLRWVVLFNAKGQGGKSQVEYWGAWKTWARADAVRELVSDGRL